MDALSFSFSYPDFKPPSLCFSFHKLFWLIDIFNPQEVHPFQGYQKLPRRGRILRMQRTNCQTLRRNLHLFAERSFPTGTATQGLQRGFRIECGPLYPSPLLAHCPPPFLPPPPLFRPPPSPTCLLPPPCRLQVASTHKAAAIGAVPDRGGRTNTYQFERRVVVDVAQANAQLRGHPVWAPLGEGEGGDRGAPPSPQTGTRALGMYQHLSPLLKIFEVIHGYL